MHPIKVVLTNWVVFASLCQANAEHLNRNRSSQATASAYGWVFQVGAGIYLMLEKVKDFTHIEMESKNEDIEITYADGSKLYAQAKSVTDPNDNIGACVVRHLSTKLYKEVYK